MCAVTQPVYHAVIIRLPNILICIFSEDFLWNQEKIMYLHRSAFTRFTRIVPWFKHLRYAKMIRYWFLKTYKFWKHKMYWNVAARDKLLTCTCYIQQWKIFKLTTNYLAICTQKSRFDNHAVTDTLSTFWPPLTNQRKE